MTLAERQTCRVCGVSIDAPALDLPAPALATTNAQLNVPTRVYVCGTCAHVQSPELPNLAQFYDTNYKISLESEEMDQLYEMRGEVPVYRTDRQAEIVLEKAKPSASARMLDYGAAKASTLRKVLARRADLIPHVFDVSEDYRSFWSAWLTKEQTATYALPESWAGRFDLITAHYVLEHVAEPVSALRGLASLLAPRGQIFFSVPDWTANAGDLLCADHINHFTKESLLRLLAEAGLAADDIDASTLPSAFVVTCRMAKKATAAVANGEVAAAAASANRTATAWNTACRKLDAAFAARAGRKAAVYGAGFYGAFLMTRMAGRIHPIRCLDNNRHLWGKTLFDVPVDAPDSLPPEVEVVYVGLNPARARSIAATIPPLAREGLDLVFIDL